MTLIECPSCGEDERLAGHRPADREVIHVDCEACGFGWDRSLVPHCPKCESEDVIEAQKAIVEKSRGSQLSIVSTEVIVLCKQCEPDLVHMYRIGRSPLMPDQLPTT